MALDAILPGQRDADIEIVHTLDRSIKASPNDFSALQRWDRSTKVGGTRWGGRRNPTISLTTAQARDLLANPVSYQT